MKHNEINNRAQYEKARCFSIVTQYILIHIYIKNIDLPIVTQFIFVFILDFFNLSLSKELPSVILLAVKPVNI